MRSSLNLILFLTCFFAGTLLANIKNEKPKKKSVYTDILQKRSIHDEYLYPAQVYPAAKSTVLAEREGVVMKLTQRLGHKVDVNTTVIQLQHTDPVYKFRPLSIKSPIKGTIVRVFVGEGHIVKKGDPLLTIIDPQKLFFKLEVTAKDYHNFKVGQLGNFTSVSSQGKIPVKITGIAPYIDPTTGTATVELERVVTHQSQKKLQQLIPGPIGQIKFELNPRQSFLVSEGALHYVGKNAFLRLVENGKIKKVPVTLGKWHKGNVELLKGIAAGATYVERTSQFLSDGDEVEIVDNNKNQNPKNAGNPT